MIKEIAFTCYPVKDIKKARTFYEDVLGLKATSVFEMENMAFVEYDIGGGTFAIGMGSDSFIQSDEGAAVAFEVDDFDETVEKLKSHGIKFVMEPMEHRTCFMALIRDPDGSKLMIHKRK